MQDIDLDEEVDSVEEDSWVTGVALKSYVYPSTSRLMYNVQVNHESMKVPFGEIQTLHAHTELLETDNEEEHLNIDGLYKLDLQSDSTSDTSLSADEVDDLLTRDDIGDDSDPDSDEIGATTSPTSETQTLRSLRGRKIPLKGRHSKMHAHHRSALSTSTRTG